VPLTPEERHRVRRHLGFTSTTPVASIAFGVPRGGESLYMVETAMNNLMEVAEPDVRLALARLDTTLAQILQAQEHLQAKSIDEIETNPEETERLWAAYRTWQQDLAGILGVYPSRYDQRAQGGSVNVRVVH